MRPETIGELLVAKARVTARDLDNALQMQTQSGGLLGQALVRLGAVSEEDLLSTLSEQLSLPVQRREEMPTPSSVQHFIDQSGVTTAWWIDHQAVPWRGPDGGVVCAAVHPLDPELLSLLQQRTEGSVDVRLASKALVEATLEGVQDRGAATVGDTADASRLRELAEEAPVIDFVNGLFADALQRNASDVHIEPFEDNFVVRMRIDGALHTVRTAARSRFDAVCSRIKLLSAMDIGERRLPQDGRQGVRISGQELDLRVSTLPTTWGESVVMRLLGKSSRLPELTELGLRSSDAGWLRSMVDQPNGIVLITGPTGSGKTTTIYRLLTHLNGGERKIITVEDPVEIDLAGVMQVQVRSDIGLSFAAGLRSILRQDPDVIMVGEIRDPETARIAVQAALTGHMVISTLHTNSSLASVGRLLDLGVEEYLLSDVLRGVAAQRLLRRVCPECSRPVSEERRQSYELASTAAVVGLTDQEEANWRDAVGCPACGFTGFRGRVGAYEIAAITPAVAGRIRTRGSEQDLLLAARSDGFLSLYEDAVIKARRGETVMGEVYRVIGTPESLAPGVREEMKRADA